MEGKVGVHLSGYRLSGGVTVRGRGSSEMVADSYEMVSGVSGQRAEIRVPMSLGLWRATIDGHGRSDEGWYACGGSEEGRCWIRGG
jgi:hypothetical protein